MSKAEETYSYKYYILGGVTPVRVTLDEHGREVNAEAPDPQSGTLKIRTTLLSRLATSWEVEEIDSRRFHEICAERNVR